MNDTMKKIAQERSNLTRLNPKNWGSQIDSARSRLNDETHDEEMSALNRADEKIREMGKDLKRLSKELKRNTKNHRWYAAMDRAASINNIIKNITSHKAFQDLAIDETKLDDPDFYFEKRDSKGRDVGQDNIQQSLSRSARISYEDHLITEAFFENTGRRGTEAFKKRRRSEKTKEIKKIMNNLSSRADQMAKAMLGAFKELNTSRIRGDVREYLATINSMEKKRGEFQKVYDDTFNSVKGFLNLTKTQDQLREEIEPDEIEYMDPDGSGVKDLGDEINFNEIDGKKVPNAPDKPSGFNSLYQNNQSVPSSPSGMSPAPSDQEQADARNDNLNINIDGPAATQHGSPQPTQQGRSALPNPPQSPSQVEAERAAQQAGFSSNTSFQTTLPGYEDLFGNNTVPFTDPDGPLRFETNKASSSEIAMSAKKAIASGDRGIAAALLSKYSQELEDAGNMRGSVEMLALAEQLLGE